MSVPDPGELDELLHALSHMSGLSRREDWTIQVLRGLGLVAARRATSPEALLRNRAGWTALLPELLDHITVRETFFFRNRDHFDFTVADLHTRLSADSLATACVLSAGCATGEEPYSVAIAIHARLGLEGLARVRIVASDISPEAIGRARAGVYTSWAFREAPSWLSQAYLRSTEGRGARVVDFIREAVTFDVGHVVHHAAALPEASVDAVFFRNVAIYLSPEAIAEAYREFRRVLRPGGLLIVAPADPRPNAAHFMDVGHESTSIYRARSEADASHIAPAPPAHRPRIEPRPPPRTPSKPPTAPPPPLGSAPEDPLVEAQALRLADSGDQAATLSVVANLLDRPSTAPVGYLIRAQLALDHGRPHEAVDDLRRTLFLRPEHRLARYWYVVALQGAGHIEQAMIHGRELEALLSRSSSDALVEDGETTVGQLLDSIKFVREGMR